MRTTMVLLKNYFLAGVGAFLGKKRKRNSAAILTLVLLFGALFGLSTWGQIKSGQLFAGNGIESVLLIQAFTMSIFLMIFFGLQKITGGARANDADLLLSMPIRRVHIVVAKSVSKWLFNFCTLMLIAFPYVIAYLVVTGFSAWLLFSSIFMFLFVALFGVAVSYIFDGLLIIVFRRLRFANLFRIVVTFAALGTFLVAINSHSAVFGLIDWFCNFALAFSWANFVKILALTILPFVLGVLVFSYNFGRENAPTKKAQIKEGESPQYLKKRTQAPVEALFKKEFKTFFATPTWVINSIVGPVLLVGLCLFAVFGDLGSVVGQFFQGAGGAGLPLLLTIAFCLTAALTCASAASISLEGKNLWLLKTAPIHPFKIIFVKAFLNIVIFAPAAAVGGIMVGVALSFSVMQVIVLVTLPIILCVLISFLGVFVNLLLPKLDWDSEMQAVKQSLSVVVVMFSGLIIAAVPILLMIVSSNIAVIVGVSTAFYTAAAVACVLLCAFVGPKLFNKL